MKTDGYTLEELDVAGFTAEELRVSGFTANELRAAQFIAAKPKSRGSSPPQQSIRKLLREHVPLIQRKAVKAATNVDNFEWQLFSSNNFSVTCKEEAEG